MLSALTLDYHSVISANMLRVACSRPDASGRRARRCRQADAYRKIGLICQANSGELALRTGAKDEAALPFRLAAGDCPKMLAEWYAVDGRSAHEVIEERQQPQALLRQFRMLI